MYSSKAAISDCAVCASLQSIFNGNSCLISERVPLTYSSKFLVNSPPGLTTGRINLKVPLAEERVQKIAEWNGLIIEFDDDVTVSLHGDKPDLQIGLKEMGSFFLEE